MNTNRTCGCKSFNTCYICEKEFGLKPRDWGQQLKEENRTFFEFSIESGTCFNHDSSSDALDNFSGIVVIPDFISLDEEAELINHLDCLPWDVSQSGRRKQNFGPRANFKKRKAKVGPFKGFPQGTKFIQERFETVPMLEDYKTVEQCSIEYSPDKGACIEPHIDDCWIWGERIVQLNLMSDSYLTCTPYTGDNSKYNLADIDKYPRVIGSDNKVIFNPFKDKFHKEQYGQEHLLKDQNIAVKIPLPARSLLIMFGQARYEFEHAILRQDIQDRRIVIAYRELTPPYLPGGKEEQLGKEILTQAKLFW